MRPIAISFFLLLSATAMAQDIFEAYEKKEFLDGAYSLSYRILYPQNFDTTKAYPLLVFLHGAGGKGYDNEVQLNSGGRFFLRPGVRDSFPAIVVFPQCPLEDLWAYFDTQKDSVTKEVVKLYFPFRKEPTPVSRALMKLVDSLTQRHFVNNKRVYLGGLSQGGMGVLDLVARYPDVFAAAISICGAGDPVTSKRFAGKVPLWLFHGDKDDVIPVSYSRAYYRRLRKEGAEVRYSEYEGVKHNSWANAFREPDFLSWLFSKSK